jgi:tetratricopeptide (TPR) repeat protein
MSESRAVAPSRPTSLWIRGPALDLILFIGVPVLLLPLILARPGRPAVQDWILYLGGFGALGHHLPGMLRAYGDRELFRRFRVRLILAPLFLSGVCVAFALGNLGGVLLVTFLWTTWHTLMQIYGFARIYDAKVGSTARLTSRLDHALCIAWIGMPIAFSDSRTGYVLELFYRCGGPLIPPGLVEGARQSWMMACLGLTAGFLLNLFVSWRSGVRPNRVKLLFFAVSFGFWWFCMAQVDHLLVGIALFDVFHDVQYLALVWLFQRRAVEGGGGVGGFTRFLFRRSGALIGLYVGLVVAYGSMGMFAEGLRSETFRNALLGVLAASALFHFYLDGFIWKVRERGTRATLGITEQGASATALPRVPSWARHLLKWALFVVPLSLLAAWELGGKRPTRVWRERVAETVPDSAEALTYLGAEQVKAGEIAEGIRSYRRAIELKPTYPDAFNNLGVAMRMDGQVDAAISSWKEAVRLRPEYARAHGHLANALAALGQTDEAELHYRRAIEQDAEYADARANLAALLVGRGQASDALPLFREALAIDPDNRGALNNLAWIQATSADASLRNPPAALELAQRLDRLTGHLTPQVLDTLAAAQAAGGMFAEARNTAAQAIAAARSGGNEALAQQIGQHLQLYAQGRALGN